MGALSANVVIVQPTDNQLGVHDSTEQYLHSHAFAPQEETNMGNQHCQRLCGGILSCEKSWTTSGASYMALSFAWLRCTGSHFALNRCLSVRLAQLM